MTDAIVSGEVLRSLDEPSPYVLVAQELVRSIYNFPSEAGEIGQITVRSFDEPTPDLISSGLLVRVIIKGRVDNHLVRVWAFSLDGHDFYVITLGENTTLVYDLTTDQWSEWTTPGYNTWRAHVGTNWISMGADTYSAIGSNAQSNVVAGDNLYGRLWLIDPGIGYDEDVLTGDETSFPRKVVGGIQQKLRETQKIGAVYLLASAGSPQLTGANITLRTSDNLGKTWNDHGTLDVTVGYYTQEYVWRSLGLIKQPGKLFEITDDGGTVRIDSLDMR